MKSNKGVRMDKRSDFYISFEIGDLTKIILTIILSFIVTIVIVAWIKQSLKNNFLGIMIFSAIALVSLFFARRIGILPVRSYVERYGLFVIPSVLAGLFVAFSLKPAVFVILFIIHGMLCLFLRTFKNTLRLGIELIMLITILGSFVYGATTGAILGVIAMLMDYALTARFSYFVPVTTLSYMLIGLLAVNFSGFGIVFVGIAATIIYNIITSFAIVAFMGGHLEKCLRFGISNIALNVVLFTAVAPRLLGALA